MALRYVEDPLLFVLTTDSSNPNGRNVRTQFRTQQAPAPAAHASDPLRPGAFAVLDFRNKRPAEETRGSSVKRLRYEQTSPPSPAIRTGQLRAAPLVHSCNDSAVGPRTPSRLPNPSNTLIVAAFHIRRMTATALGKCPDRLTEVLRFRQWSCVPTAIERFGANPCLDAAFTCLALKLDRMTGGPTTDSSLLFTHTEALHKLQEALAEPRQYELRDLFTAIQLLAVFEMLDSLDNVVWLQHVAGAESLLLSKRTDLEERNETAFELGTVTPMIADALLTGNGSFFNDCGWRTPIHSLISGSQNAEAELLTDLLEVLQIISDARSFKFAMGAESANKYDLLDRAHGLRIRLRSALMDGDKCLHREWGKLESFDKLGLCVSGLLALDRLIGSLRPGQPSDWEDEEDGTSALCAQLLQLELKEADANPATELLSAFQLSN